MWQQSRVSKIWFTRLTPAAYEFLCAYLMYMHILYVSNLHIHISCIDHTSTYTSTRNLTVFKIRERIINILLLKFVQTVRWTEQKKQNNIRKTEKTLFLKKYFLNCFIYFYIFLLFIFFILIFNNIFENQIIIFLIFCKLIANK